MPAWQAGDPAAGRRFAELGGMTLDSGVRLPAVRVAYETWGTAHRGPDGSIDNAVLVEHALTGDAHVAGPAGAGQSTPGWWDPLVGPGRAIDTDRWFVLAANVLGGCQGTTGPGSPAADGRRLGTRFPAVSVRDQVAVEAALADRLGIERFATVLGGSMGGMRALEWAVGRPDRVAGALLLAVGASASADQVATQTLQIQAIQADPAWAGGDYDGAGPVAGLGIARRIAHLTYRSSYELDVRFGRTVQDDGRYAVTSYLDHHAAKLVGRFDAGSYVVLTGAMNGYDVGRGRGGVPAALAGVSAAVVVAGIDSDRLYPLRQQEELAALIPTADGLHVVTSDYGHDGFLIEAERVGELVRHTLRRAERRTSAA